MYELSTPDLLSVRLHNENESVAVHLPDGRTMFVTGSGLTWEVPAVTVQS